MLENEIKTIAKDIGIPLIGFTTAEPFIELKERLLARQTKGYLSGFEEPDIEKRIHPKKVMSSAMSIISIGIPYHTGKEYLPSIESKGPKGRLARTAWGRDYHIVLKEKMTELVKRIELINGDFEYYMQVDTGPLVDREVAYRAGLGGFGKNNLLINPKYGSYLYLGSILVDFELTPDTPIEIACGDCEICLTACPSKALEGPNVMNAKKCVSYNTQRKDLIPLDIRATMGTQLYGCDACQERCPYNQNLVQHNGEDFIPKDVLHKVDIEELLRLTNKEFKESFGKTASGWRGKKVIQRNGIIALGNTKSKRAIPLLEACLDHENSEFRLYSAWALGQILDSSVKDILIRRLEIEASEEVKEEIQNALQKVVKRGE